MDRGTKLRAKAGQGVPGKQVAHEMLPSRHSMATITGGHGMNRMINDYAKNTPADADGEGAGGLNIVGMARWG